MPLEGGGEDDRRRFDDGEGENFRGFVLELVGVGRRCGTKIFRRFDSINLSSRVFFSGD